MNLEGNNYDTDTLMIYYQDSEITARQLIKDAPENLEEEYNKYIGKRNVDDTEEEAEKFLDWWMDEERDTEEEDLLEEIDREDQRIEEETRYPWEEDQELRKKLVFGPASHKVCLWRYRNPMEDDKEKCSKETEVPISEVNIWWNIPDYINDKKGYHFMPPPNFNEYTLQNLLLINYDNYN